MGQNNLNLRSGDPTYTIDQIRLSGTTYELRDNSAIHNLNGYWTSGQTQEAITAATSALAESIAEQHYQTSGDVQNAISGKADTTAVTEAISEAVSGKADTTAVTQAIDEAVSGKADYSGTVTSVSATSQQASGMDVELRLSVTKGRSSSVNTFTKFKKDYFTWNADGIGLNTTNVALKSDIPSVTGYADAVKYDTNTKYMKFYHGGTGGTEVFSFDASPFLIDGMVQNVEIKDVTISGESVTCLVISFNTDAGKQDINIPLTDIFDASNYYTKSETDDEIDAKIAAASAVTTGEVQTMIDQSISGKADTTAMTQAISEATSGKVDNSTYTAYTAATDTALAGKANTGDVVTNVGATADYSGAYQNQFVIYQTKNGSDSVVGRLASGTGIEIYRGPGTYVDYVKVDTNTIQEKLTSGTNIKTVGGNSLLGSGDIAFPAGLQVQVTGTTLVFG